MKLVFLILVAAALSLAIFSFSEANAECGNMTGDCDNNGNMKTDTNYDNNDDNTKSNDNNNNDNDILKDTDRIPVNCNVKDCSGVEYVCPDDFSSECYRVIDNNNNGHTSDNNNHKSSSVEKFKVHVNLIYLNAVGGEHKFRVIVYGPHTLNKPTLDKPGYPFKLEACDDDHCRFDLGTVSFTSWKVPKDSSFETCVWPSKDSSEKSCAWGKATSRSVDITVTARD